jgi:hypothetical protein
MLIANCGLQLVVLINLSWLCQLLGYYVENYCLYYMIILQSDMKCDCINSYWLIHRSIMKVVVVVEFQEWSLEVKLASVGVYENY